MSRNPRRHQGTAIVRWMSLEPHGQRSLPSWLSTLDPAERQRADRFHVAADRLAFVAAHWLTRTMLASSAGVPAAEWRFAVGEFGRPEIHPSLGHRNLRFNMSHTRGLVACGVAYDDDVGIDVEAIDHARADSAIADRYFHPDEAQAIRFQHTAASRCETFFRVWTLKEAVIKATGLGLHLPLDAFSITLDPLEVAFHDAASAFSHDRWTLVQHHVAERYLVAAAIRSRPGHDIDDKAASPTIEFRPLDETELPQ